ncbi:MAG: substrate-binding domain-containing protein [Planctomycetaceae bacterium]|nr:extracellular solute-binding protein [Planctomycetaceae bacterium]
MKRIVTVLFAAAILAALVVVLWPAKAPGPQCLVGGTMTPLFHDLAEAYWASLSDKDKQSGALGKVEISSGDSGELMARIEMGQQGDLYVAHDPFMDQCVQRKLGTDVWTVGELVPVLVVQKGNPKKIASLADLQRPDVRVYLTDYEHSTMGWLLPTIFSRGGVDFAKLNETKKIPTHRSGSWVANQVIMNQADAAIVWQAVAALRSKDLDVINIDAALPRPGVDAITSASGKSYYLTPVKVGLVLLASSKRREQALKFVEFVRSDAAKPIFLKHSFKVSDIFGRAEYVKGVKVAPASQPQSAP